MNAVTVRDRGRAPPPYPSVFIKPSNSVAGYLEDIPAPEVAQDGYLNYEGECFTFLITSTTIDMNQALFHVAGYLVVATGIVAFLYWVIRRLQKDDGRSGKEMTFKGVLNAMQDWKIWIPGFIYLGVFITAYSISIFTPTILSTFDWESIKANLLSSPIRASSAVVSVLVAMLSDKVKRRGIFIIGGFVVSAVGNVVVMVMKGGTVRCVSLYIAAIGIYTAHPLVIGWA
ncbi:hypothetical protein ACHAPJ_007793 [Fusarium lateritium]